MRKSILQNDAAAEDNTVDALHMPEIVRLGWCCEISMKMLPSRPIVTMRLVTA
jgi:hypothetical protein